MRYLEHRFVLDVRQGVSRVNVKVKRDDTARMLRISLVDGILPYVIEPDCYAVFSAVKPDGNRLFNPCLIEDNFILYPVTPQTVAVEGLVECEIRLYGGDDMLITSPAFDMSVSGVLYDEDQVPQSETEVTVLTKLITDASAVIAEGLEMMGDIEELKKQLEVGSGGTVFDTDDTLRLENGILSVNTADAAEPDNTLPITSAAVYAQLGNIEIILGTI